jgi:hypothetical protein
MCSKPERWQKGYSPNNAVMLEIPKELDMHPLIQKVYFGLRWRCRGFTVAKAVIGDLKVSVIGGA